MILKPASLRSDHVATLDRIRWTLSPKSALDERLAEWVIPCRLNAYDLPLSDQSVDAVMAMQFLHFVGDPSSAVGEIKRVLKSDGLLIVNGPSEDSPKFDIVSEITRKARAYYGQALKEKGAGEFGFSGGWTARQIRENLPKFFCNFQTVKSEHLVFKYVQTPGWFLAKLGSRYTAYQLGFEQKVHVEAMQDVHDRLISEYGEAFEKIEQEYCSVHRLNVYSD